MTTSAKTNANGQTVAERKLDIDRLEGVLQGLIVMLRDNPDIPIPWHVDVNCEMNSAAYEQLLERHGLESLGNAPWMAYLGPIFERYSALEDRSGFYLPWSVTIKREDQPL